MRDAIGTRPREIVSGKWQATGLGSKCRWSINQLRKETAMIRSRLETTVFWFLLTLSLMVPWLMLD